MIEASRIAAIFERFTSGYHFYLEDLRSGESVELGERAAWPIGSCFKLAVLIAYFEALADGSLPPDSLDAETRIPPERFSTGGGVVNFLDTPLSLTDRQMLRLMIAASDGTATDVLIDKLGLDRVQATLKRAAPDSTLACGLDEMVRRFRDIPGALDCKTRDWTADGARAFRDATSQLGATNAVDLARLALAAFTPPPQRNSPGVSRSLLSAPGLAQDEHVPGRGVSGVHEDGLSGSAILHAGVWGDPPKGQRPTRRDLRLLRRGVPATHSDGRCGDGDGRIGDGRFTGPASSAERGLDGGSDGVAFGTDLTRTYSGFLSMPRAYPRSETFLPAHLASFNKGGSLGMRYFSADCAVVSDQESAQPLYAFGFCSEGWRMPAFAVETACGLIGLEMAKALGIAAKPNWDFTPEGAKLLLGDLWPG